MNIRGFQLLGRFSTPIFSSLAHIQTASRLWKMLFCVNSLLHICSAAICPDPPEIDHGSVNITGNCIGDYAHYTCDPGFKLTGDPYLTCEKLDNYTAAFQPNPPVCHRECCMNWLIMPSCINNTRIQRATITVHWCIYLQDEYPWFSTTRTIFCTNI